MIGKLLFYFVQLVVLTIAMAPFILLGWIYGLARWGFVAGVEWFDGHVDELIGKGKQVKR